MSIKQQKQIKAFLIEEFGKEKGNALFDMQAKTLDGLIENTTDKSKNQMKTLIQTILPRIALYKALSCYDTQNAAYDCVQKYMIKRLRQKSIRLRRKWKQYRDFTRFTAKFF